MTLINKLRAALRFVRWNHWPEPAEWTTGDRAQLNGFLDGETGQKLRRLIGNGIIASNSHVVDSANGNVRLDFLAGDANGFRRCACYLEALGAVEESEQTTEGTENSGLQAS